MKLLITGGAGFIGSAIIRHIINNTNHSVVNVDKLTYVGDRVGHDVRYAIDATKIANELNWTLDEIFTTGIKKTIQWYLDNKTCCERVQDRSYQGERLGVINS